jgi:hypothetical protein
MSDAALDPREIEATKPWPQSVQTIKRWIKGDAVQTDRLVEEMRNWLRYWGCDVDLDKHHTAPPEANHPWRPTNTRGKVLATAESLVNGDRNASYGDPNHDFARTAVYWQEHVLARLEVALRGRILDNEVELTMNMIRDVATEEAILGPTDVAIMMSLLKISRLAWSPTKADSWVDLAGYAACGADCAGVEL